MPSFKEHSKSFISSNGLLLGIIRLIFYPISQTLINPVRLVKLVSGSRVLFFGTWGNYTGFVPQNAFSILFYWIRAMNIYKYGIKGKSPYIGLGDYPLARAFYYSLGSLYSFWLGPLVTILLGLFGWFFFHGVWIDANNWEWILMISGITLISTLFYINLIQQNYNAVGWLFFPLFLFALLKGYWILAGFALVLISFGSITVVFLGGLLSLSIAAYNVNIYPLLVLIPAGIKLLFHFIPLLNLDKSAGIVISIVKAIGMTGRNVKYKRKRKGKIDLLFLYFSALQLQFIIFYYLVYNEWSIIVITGLVIFWINKLFVRFADDQSMHMLTLSIGFAALAMQDYHIITLLSFWLMVNPFPLTTNIYDRDNIDLVPKGKPFNIKPILEIMKDFLKDIKKGNRVLLCFNDPENVYEQLFDGYRHLIEVPHYVANLKEFHFMPGWWGVSELNYEGADDFWGREPDLALKNVERWNLDYIIVYQKAGTVLDQKWEKHGFQEMASLNWEEIERDFNYKKFYKPESPSWWLLRVP